MDRLPFDQGRDVDQGPVLGRKEAGSVHQFKAGEPAGSGPEGIDALTVPRGADHGWCHRLSFWGPWHDHQRVDRKLSTTEGLCTRPPDAHQD